MLCLAPTQKQAQLVFRYCEAFLTTSPVLRQEIRAVTADEIRLAGNVTIAVHPSSFRSVRGRTLLGVVLDEIAYFRDETSTEPDVETYRAVLPALASTGGMLIGISSPYRRTGLLHAKHRDHFGKDDDDVLVIQGGSQQLNPTLSAGIIERAMQADPAAALSEWQAQFRSDLNGLIDDAVIDAAIDFDRPLELPPLCGASYFAFVDASAGRHDAFTIGIGHREGDHFIADVIRGRRPPFDPGEVAAEYAALAKDYGCYWVTGDNFSGEWAVRAFQDAGVTYERASSTKSQLYLEALPSFMRGQVSIPNHPQLLRELRLLERRTHRSGRDSVDHGSGGSDDHANALCGCLAGAVSRPRYGLLEVL